MWDRTALSKLMQFTNPVMCIDDRQAVIPELVDRTVSPYISVFSVLSQMSQPYSLGNGRALQYVICFWMKCQPCWS